MLFDNRCKLFLDTSLVGASTFTSDVYDIGANASGSGPMYLKVNFPTLPTKSGSDDGLVLSLQGCDLENFGSGVVELWRVGDFTNPVLLTGFVAGQFAYVVPLVSNRIVGRYVRLRAHACSVTAAAVAGLLAVDQAAGVTAALASIGAPSGAFATGTITAFLSSDAGPGQAHNISDAVS
jgi:hypothetical protein